MFFGTNAQRTTYAVRHTIVKISFSANVRQMFTPIEISERKALANEMAIICRHNFRIEQRHFHVHEIHFRVLTLNELQAEKKIQCKNFR